MAILLPPESAPVKAVLRELGVSVSTLERWRSATLAEPERGQFVPQPASIVTCIVMSC